MSFLNYLILATCGLLFSICIYILSYNWGEKALSLFFPSFFGGLAIVAITLLFALKGDEIKIHFYEHVIIDTETSLPISVGSLEFVEQINKLKESHGSESLKNLTDESIKFSYGNHINRLSWLESRATAPVYEGNISAPSGDDEIRDFYIELIQYALLEDFRWLSRQHYESSQFIEDGVAYMDATKHIPFELSDVENAFAKFKNEINSMRFYKSSNQESWWSKGEIMIPEGTDISVFKETNEKGILVGKIILSKKHFFDIEFSIELIKEGGKGVLPSGYRLNLSKDTIKKLKSYTFRIDLHAKFYRITGLSPKTAEYKQWVSWLLEEFNLKYAD